jgi:tellurite resistance protein TerC
MTFPIRKVAVAAIGFGVVALGLALIVLPGPAVLVIPLGLAILAKEFPWARKLLDKIKQVLWRLKARALQVLGKAPGPRAQGSF